MYFKGLELLSNLHNFLLRLFYRVELNSNNEPLLRSDCVYLYPCELYKVSEKSPTTLLEVELNYRVNIRTGTAYFAYFTAESRLASCCASIEPVIL